jgi:hypothetical protein
MTRPVRINKTELRRVCEVARETGMRAIIRRDGSIVLEARQASNGEEYAEGDSKAKDCVL